MSTKRKLPTKLGQPVVNQSAKIPTKETLDDSKAVVSGGGGVNGSQDVVEISSDESSDDGEEEDEDEDEEPEANDAQQTTETVDQDTEMADLPISNENEEPAEPSFGDLILANTNGPIDVSAAFPDPRPLSYPTTTTLALPSGASLGTVLTQALKTNDVSLLESCLQTSDLTTIRSTIQRLSSPLASVLLSKLAERLHRRPGRAGSLMVWIQWTLVTHGGYLATQPDLIKKLAELNRVIDERARGLQSLLSLKGKLDMLEAQMQLRRSMRDARRGVDESDEEDGVVYVEGEESDDESTEKPNGTSRRAAKASAADLGDESDESEDMPTTTGNGMIADSDVSDEEDSSDGGLLDDEAEETDADSGDEDEVDHEDQDSLDEDEDSDDAAPVPSKLQKVGGRGLFSKRN